MASEAVAGTRPRGRGGDIEQVRAATVHQWPSLTAYMSTLVHSTVATKGITLPPTSVWPDLNAPTVAPATILPLFARFTGLLAVAGPASLRQGPRRVLHRARLDCVAAAGWVQPRPLLVPVSAVIPVTHPQQRALLAPELSYRPAVRPRTYILHRTYQ